MASFFDPFNTDEVGDPFTEESPRGAFGRPQPATSGPRPSLVGPVPGNQQAAPVVSSGVGTTPVPQPGTGFFSRMFTNPQAARNAQILEMNRQRFLPGGPLSGLSDTRKRELLKDPFSARRLIEAREAETRLRNRPLSAAGRQAQANIQSELDRQKKRHEARVKTLDAPDGPFADLDEQTKAGLRGSPDILKSVFEEMILAPAKQRRAEALRPPRPFEPTEVKKRAERAAAREDEILTAGATADQTRRSLDVIGGLLEQQKTGKLEPLRVTASEFLLDLGISPETIPLLNLPANAGPAQALDAFTSAQRLVVLSAFKGNQTERELAFTKRVLPRLANTKLGNTLVLEVSHRIAKLDQMMRDALEDHIENRRSSSSFGKVRRRIQRENPVWTKSMRNKIKAASKGPRAVTEEQIRAAKRPKRATFNPDTQRIE